MKKLLPLFALIFLLGWSVSLLVSYDNVQYASNGLEDVISPSNHVLEQDIHVYSDKVVIDVDNAFWARFSDTNSMDPVLDVKTNSIEIRPENEKQIEVGDIISFSYENKIVIHRVVLIDSDSQGLFYITKGDNVENVDPIKVRFSDVQGIVIALIY